jgi:hypothetical protein
MIDVPSSEEQLLAMGRLQNLDRSQLRLCFCSLAGSLVVHVIFPTGYAAERWICDGKLRINTYW